ncbi:MAG: phosphatidylserine decarboxylase family protein [Gemmatimonadaceae bacterium]|jgi:phosphatidylserine decarboxylase|nr:phosphatidylserine decarboxylase family protein [Gemmatimonadaceae bacterium]
MSFAREGYPFMALSAALAAAVLGAAVWRRSWALWLLGFLLLVVALWVAWFFRDPERSGPRGEGVVISPADGKVVMITEVDEPTYVLGRTTRISIFMNIFSVHVNRYPVAGIVEHVHHSPGKFLNAVTEKSSLENEHVSVGIRTARHRILTRQIAGLIARRIIAYSNLGDQAEQAARFGLIRFGSRVDVFVPTDSVVKVRLGDQAVAGTTVLAELPKA